MAKAKSASGEKQDFGAAYKELEEIIGWFEREDADLEEGLKKFERGLELAKVCKDRLKDVENKVTQIKAKFGTAPDDERPASAETLF
jgi:exodeoxyribonuclease VII small subunit